MSLKTKLTFFNLFVFLIGVWSLAWYSTSLLRGEMEQQLGNQQLSTVSMLASNINEGLEDRLGALELIAKAITPAMIAKPSDLQDFLDRRQLLHKLFNNGFFVTRIDGVTIADFPRSAGRLGINYGDRDFIVTVLEGNKSSVGTPIMGKVLHKPVFAMATPVRDDQGKVIAVLSGSIDLGYPNFLGKVTGSKFGETGGYLLVAPKQRLGITGTDQYFSMKTMPEPGVNPLLDRYVSGFEGFGTVIDSRGISILSAAKGVPAAGWILIARIPASEALAPINTMQKRILLATLIFTLAAGLLIWLITWRQLNLQLSPMIAATKMIESASLESERLKPLPIRSQDEIGLLISSFNRLLEILQQRDEYQRALLDNFPFAVWLKDTECRFLAVNEGFIRIFGARNSNDLIGKSDFDVSPQELAESYRADDCAVMASRQKKHIEEEILTDGVRKWFETYKAPVVNDEGELLGTVGFARDITERKVAADQIAQLAFYDVLTELPNRRLMLDRLGLALTSSARHAGQGALMLIDLDNFKALNDTLGHAVGDQLLIEAASRLAATIREGDTVARLGGDEFVIILGDLEEGEQGAVQAGLVAKKILEGLAKPYRLVMKSNGESVGEITHECTSSIGVTLFSGQSISGDELLKRADTAMYQAKAAGRNTLRFFDPKMQAALNERAAMEIDLRKAIVENQFVLHYQAQVDSAGLVTGAEVLVRWQHPKHGLVYPAMFIPLAEETGLILPLGHWVLSKASQQLAEWAKKPDRTHLALAVNVSARQFSLPNFVEQLLSIIDFAATPAAQLKLEFTESLLLENTEDTIIKMMALKARGIGFSIDDFGTGYSSLSYLKRLPLDQLKIDQSFVRDILTDPNDSAIAHTVVSLANSLGLGVIAEGVETEDQLHALANIGCRAYQGYLFSRPVPIEEFEALLNHA
jgi:diguanylate cyclase (GGDEF)-like protein/PAS domain S-box-containing protein